MTKTTRSQDTEFKSGQTVRNTKDSGRTIWPRTMDDSFWPMVMFTLGTGARTKLMETESITTQKVQRTKVAGLTTNRKAEAMRHGLMVLFIWETTLMARKKAKDNLNGLMEQCMMEHGRTTKWMEPEISNGLTVDNTLVST
jgi:hypothetical protein